MQNNMKFLINCSFDFYNKGIQRMNNFALIIEMCKGCNCIDLIIYEKLKELNFKLPDYKSNHHYYLNFTAQKI